MTTKRETILAALANALSVERNKPIDDFTGSFLSLRDGECELTEEFINGDVYEFTATPALVLAVEAGSTAARDTALDALIETYAALFEDARETLEALGLVSDLRVLPPDYETSDVWGALGVKSAELPIEIDYWSDRRVG